LSNEGFFPNYLSLTAIKNRNVPPSRNFSGKKMHCCLLAQVVAKNAQPYSLTPLLRRKKTEFDEEGALN
jgi:hypothetical protein